MPDDLDIEEAIESCLFCRNAGFFGACNFSAGLRAWQNANLNYLKPESEEEIYKILAKNCKRYIVNREQITRTGNKKLEEFNV